MTGQSGNEISSTSTEREAGTPAKRVLVVEDNLMNMELFEAILSIHGYEVCCMYNAEEALQIIKTLKPDVVLLDIALPGLDGLSALRLLRADAETRDLPIIIVSAHSLLTDERAAREAGCSEYLTKPISSEHLLAAVKHFANLSETTQL